MKTLIIIYLIGIVINAMVAASIWKDLTEDEELVRVRYSMVLGCVILSVFTWLFAIVYSLTSFAIKISRKKEGEE